MGQEPEIQKPELGRGAGQEVIKMKKQKRELGLEAGHEVVKMKKT